MPTHWTACCSSDQRCYVPSRFVYITRMKFAVTLLLLVVASSTFSQSGGPKPRPAPPHKITAIKALLFYSDKGSFSRDVLAKPDFTLWNTIIGEGDAEGPSDAMLVLVEVTGSPSPNEPSPRRAVEFTAVASGKILLKRTKEIDLFGEDGKFYAPFWLYETGCHPVKLTARISGQAKPSSLSKTVPFACGE